MRIQWTVVILIYWEHISHCDWIQNYANDFLLICNSYCQSLIHRSWRHTYVWSKYLNGSQDTLCLNLSTVISNLLCKELWSQRFVITVLHIKLIHYNDCHYCSLWIHTSTSNNTPVPSCFMPTNNDLTQIHHKQGHMVKQTSTNTFYPDPHIRLPTVRALHKNDTLCASEMCQ